MSSSGRAGEFLGGRFYERAWREGSGWTHGAAFESTGSEPRDIASVITEYHPDHHFEHYMPHRHDTLFDSIPEHHSVEHAYATEGARHQIPTLLGMAARHSLERRGRLPDPSHNLSAHSAKLAQNLVDRGAVQPRDGRTQMTVANNLNRSHARSLAEGELEEVRNTFDGSEAYADRDRVLRGRQFVRDVLKQKREKFTEVGEQMPLFDKGGK